jgi:hypothetical protein
MKALMLASTSSTSRLPARLRNSASSSTHCSPRARFLHSHPRQIPFRRRADQLRGLHLRVVPEERLQLGEQPRYAGQPFTFTPVERRVVMEHHPPKSAVAFEDDVRDLLRALQRLGRAAGLAFRLGRARVDPKDDGRRQQLKRDRQRDEQESLDEDGAGADSHGCAAILADRLGRTQVAWP